MQKVNLVGALERGIDKTNPEHDWNTGNIHVSDLSVFLPESDRKCPRALWMRLRDFEKKPLSPGKKLMFMQGNRLHEIAAELLDKGLQDWHIAGIEVNISDGLPEKVTGRTDLIMERNARNLKQKNEVMIVDFKTMRGGAFSYLDGPKESHKLQVRTYMYATGADYGAVLYIDREGQNFARQFFIKEDNFMVEAAIKKAKAIAYQENMPEKMKPKIKINNNKGNDSVNVDNPWQCQYCDYINVSCEGAIPADYEDKLGKVCGHINQQGFTPLDEVEGIEQYVEPVLRQKEVI